MTDEDRAREIVSALHRDNPDLWPAEKQISLGIKLLDAFAAVRGKQREKDAGIAEGEMCEESPTHELDIGYDMACQDIAAAIRARGSK